MIRLFAIILAAFAFVAAIVWLADLPGDLVFTIDAYEVHMRTAVAIALVALFALAVSLLVRLAAALIASPGAIGAWFAARRMRRGNDAVSEGLLAVASGDMLEARRHGERAHGLLGGHPLALLLRAQTAVLAGDATAQRHIYRAMLDHPQTEFLGLRGLFLLAGQEDKPAQALEFARRAHDLRPRVGWAAQALFELAAAHGDWAAALGALGDAQRFKLIEGAVARRRRAVLLAAQALEADRSGAREAALEFADQALSLDAGLVPAAVLMARRLAASGKTWRAQNVIEACWALAPHPDLAEAYAAIKPDETHAERMARLVGLAHLNRDHVESRLLEAEEAVLSKDFAEARRLLAPLAGDEARARVCALMAEIEEGENGDATLAHAWLVRAARAPRDAEWRCNNCGASQADWSAACGHCAKFDTLGWTGGADPPANAEILPAPARRLAPKPPGIVTLPRPPGDPDPGGIEY